MKNLYQRLSMLMIVILMTLIPFGSRAQEITTVKTVRANTAPCYNYWSVGAFGG